MLNGWNMINIAEIYHFFDYGLSYWNIQWNYGSMDWIQEKSSPESMGILPSNIVGLKPVNFPIIQVYEWLKLWLN